MTALFSGAAGWSYALLSGPELSTSFVGWGPAVLLGAVALWRRERYVLTPVLAIASGVTGFVLAFLIAWAVATG